METAMTELQMQAKCVEWYWNEFRFTDNKRMLHCNMNNSFNKIAGAIAKALGVVKGASDCEFIDYDGVVWFLEFKLPGKKQEPEQVEFQEEVEKRGHKYRIIYSIEEFKQFIISRIAENEKRKLWNTGK